jgi:hypothetical protein
MVSCEHIEYEGSLAPGNSMQQKTWLITDPLSPLGGIRAGHRLLTITICRKAQFIGGPIVPNFYVKPKEDFAAKKTLHVTSCIGPYALDALPPLPQHNRSLSLTLDDNRGLDASEGRLFAELLDKHRALIRKLIAQ